MIEIIKYYDGNNGGIILNFVSKTIEKINHNCQNFNESNKSDIIFCINNEIQEVKIRLDKTLERIHQKNKKILKIEGGVSISEKPTTLQMEILKNKEKKLTFELEELIKLKNEYDK